MQDSSPLEGDLGLADQEEDDLSYEDACQESLEVAEKFRRGRRPSSTFVRGEVALRLSPTSVNVLEDLVQSLFRRVLRQPLDVVGQTCRLTLEVGLESVEHEGEEADGAACCKATEEYDDGIIIKTILPEGQVERCSVIPDGCSYRQGGRWWPQCTIQNGLTSGQVWCASCWQRNRSSFVQHARRLSLWRRSESTQCSWVPGRRAHLKRWRRLGDLWVIGKQGMNNGWMDEIN